MGLWKKMKRVLGLGGKRDGDSSGSIFSERGLGTDENIKASGQ